ncbi:protein of unknown function DUF72 [[Leptolyngbya] sp. PCC 7376]|uniref:DUF72 domain-containing protein n=1 Tax=[Leptolyngbya] sp. PCC 7376 TaxID=111781 RepID=UPI00029EF218|nr:DUF72 domain-containing protein [[Leptolyngbya] sp. PCC 7376]AFY38804.1 protein of unknown function DUF72 [[Leptolyngbya] sp. PCC 7376]
MSEFRIGCAVWSYRGWLGTFFPVGSSSQDFLRLYGDRLRTVEGNTTFYAVPSEITVSRWRVKTPKDFRFCLKFPRTVTHQGLLVPQLKIAKEFLERVKPLGDRLGCVFAQLPPSYSPAQFTDLQTFFHELANFGVQFGLETRHLHWFQEPHNTNLINWLTTENITKVLLDTRSIYNCPDNPQANSKRRKPNVPLYPVSTSNQVIIRFISHPTYSYSEPYLDMWVKQLKQWLDEDKQIYFFVHCPIEDYSPAIAKKFQHKLEAAQLQIPPLPWQKLPAEPQQLNLF